MTTEDRTPANDPTTEAWLRSAGLVIQETALSTTRTLFLDPPDRGHARVRIGGQTRAVSPAEYESIARGLYLMSCLDWSEHAMPQDGKAKLRLGSENRMFEATVCAAPDVRGPRLYVRVAELESAVRTLDQLGLDADQLASVRDKLERAFGLVILAGPRDSGRTTALYAMLAHLVAPDRNIMTAEDSVERLIAGVCQMHCKPLRGLTHAALLKTMRRQKADVCVLGEIRDYEALELSTQLATAGHLVIAGLFARDAGHAIKRMLNMGIERYMLIDASTTVIGQRLVLAPDGGRTGRFELVPVTPDAN